MYIIMSKPLNDTRRKSKSPSRKNKLAKLHANDPYIDHLNELECLFHNGRPPSPSPKNKTKSPSPNKRKGGKRSTRKKSMKKK